MPRRFTLVALIFFGWAQPIIAADAPAATVTAAEVIARIQKQVGVPWTAATVDTFKAGDPATPVKGIAVAMMATFDVLQRAAASGANLIITHEPTFYGHQDVTTVIEAENDQVLAAKQELIRKHGLVIWRFHDHLHRMKPDMVMTGVIAALGWEKLPLNAGDSKWIIPETTLENLAAQIRTKLGIRTLRVVGNPALKVTKLGFSPGASGFPAHRKMLQSPDVEVLLLGEGTEWETIEYGADAAAQGKPKALILMGHIPSEESGMRECARWLKTFVPEVPIDFVVTPEPFWAPK